MELVEPDPRRLDATDLVVRERVVGPLVLAAVVLLLALGWTVGPWLALGAPLWVRAAASLLVGLPLAWIALTLARGAARGLRRGRWTLRVGSGELWLQPRSYQNDAPGRTPAPWIRIPLADLAAACAGEQRAHVPDADGGRTHVVDRWLDLELARPAPAALVDALAAERAQRPGTRFLSYPLELRGERGLRVYWLTSGLTLAPSRERVLEALAGRVPVHAAPEADVLDAAAMPLEQADALARDLHARGRVMDAVHLLRARHGWSLGRARAWLHAGETRVA